MVSLNKAGFFSPLFLKGAVVPVMGWKSFVSRGLTSSFFMILATELGDETFIIAAVMSMQHPKFVVFLGGFVVGVSARKPHDILWRLISSGYVLKNVYMYI